MHLNIGKILPKTTPSDNIVSDGVFVFSFSSGGPIMEKAYQLNKTLVFDKKLAEMENYIAEKYSLIADTFVNTNNLEIFEFF